MTPENGVFFVDREKPRGPLKSMVPETGLEPVRPFKIEGF